MSAVRVRNLECISSTSSKWNVWNERGKLTAATAVFKEHEAYVYGMVPLVVMLKKESRRKLQTVNLKEQVKLSLSAAPAMSLVLSYCFTFSHSCSNGLWSGVPLEGYLHVSPPWTTELVWAFGEDEVLRKLKSYNLWWFYENVSAFIDNYHLKIKSCYNMEVCIPNL